MYLEPQIWVEHSRECTIIGESESLEQYPHPLPYPSILVSIHRIYDLALQTMQRKYPTLGSLSGQYQSLTYWLGFNWSFLQTFAGSQRSGCMTLSVTGVVYHFQMSAVALISGVQVEGSLSPYSTLTTIYVPPPGDFLCDSCCIEWLWWQTHPIIV